MGNSYTEAEAEAGDGEASRAESWVQDHPGIAGNSHHMMEVDWRQPGGEDWRYC